MCLPRRRYRAAGERARNKACVSKRRARKNASAKRRRAKASQLAILTIVRRAGRRFTIFQRQADERFRFHASNRRARRVERLQNNWIDARRTRRRARVYFYFRVRRIFARDRSSDGKNNYVAVGRTRKSFGERTRAAAIQIRDRKSVV